MFERYVDTFDKDEELPRNECYVCVWIFLKYSYGYLSHININILGFTKIVIDRFYSQNMYMDFQFPDKKLVATAVVYAIYSKTNTQMIQTWDLRTNNLYYVVIFIMCIIVFIKTWKT